MKFRLYATRHACLIVPECMQASQTAVDRFGPLEFLGEVDQHVLAAVDIAGINREIDAASFAVVDDRIAHRLMRSLARETA